MEARDSFCFPKNTKNPNPSPIGKSSDFVVVVRVVIRHFLKTIVVQFVFEVIG